jgi:carbonic anhydrase
LHEPGVHTSKIADFVQLVAISNAKLAAENLTKGSEVLRDLVAAKQLKIVSAMHDVATGRVTFSE